ncbi:MAG: hypothetical protein M1816_007322 [Peltula sp. TS41687]|nr:MAG: hypothetical protein M1816_007322 [Peltula sp. TS41687]
MTDAIHDKLKETVQFEEGQKPSSNRRDGTPAMVAICLGTAEDTDVHIAMGSTIPKWPMDSWLGNRAKEMREQFATPEGCTILEDADALIDRKLGETNDEAVQKGILRELAQSTDPILNRKTHLAQAFQPRTAKRRDRCTRCKCIFGYTWASEEIQPNDRLFPGGSCAEAQMCLNYLDCGNDKKKKMENLNEQAQASSPFNGQTAARRSGAWTQDHIQCPDQATERDRDTPTFDTQRNVWGFWNYETSATAFAGDVFTSALASTGRANGVAGDDFDQRFAVFQPAKFKVDHHHATELLVPEPPQITLVKPQVGHILDGASDFRGGAAAAR